MSDVESSVDITAGSGTSVATATRGGKFIQEVIPAGLGGTVLATAVTVGTSAVALPSSALTSRKALAIYNNGQVPIYLGGSGVTTAAGIPIQPGDGPVPFDLAAGAVLYAIAATTGQDVRVVEVS
jgi:hypothetical protein